MEIIITNDNIKYTGSSEELKKDISKRFVERKNKFALQMAKETGVTVKTLYNWSNKYVKTIVPHLLPIEQSHYLGFSRPSGKFTANST